MITGSTCPTERNSRPGAGMAVLKRSQFEGVQNPPKRRRAPNTAHAQLVRRGERWLKSLNCKVVFRDQFRAVTSTGEQPDVIGWRDGLSLLIECKVSRADFLKDAKKPFRTDPSLGMGDWRFYLCPPQVIAPEDLPHGWGLLWAYPRQIRRIHGIPGNTQWHTSRPFTGCKEDENRLLVSALRRLAYQGHFEKIYDTPWAQEG